MSLSQFRSNIAKHNAKFNESIYHQLTSIINDPSLVDDQMTFAYWYRPFAGELKYYAISLDSFGISCSIQANYNLNHSKLLTKTTRRAWFEPGRELLTVIGNSLDECNALLSTVTLLIDDKITSNDFNYYISGCVRPIEPKQSRVDDIATPGKPVGPANASTKRQTVPPPLKTYSKPK